MENLRTPKRLILLAALAALMATGCQTFTLTKEEFEKQQRGEMVDPDVGGAAAFLGTVSYYGASIGAAAAGVK